MTFLEIYLLFSLLCFIIFHLSHHFSIKTNYKHSLKFPNWIVFFVQIGIAIVPVANLIGLAAVFVIWCERLTN